MKKIKVGVIGVGGIAQQHLRPLTQITEGVEVVALVDVMPGRAKEQAEKWGVKHAFTDYNEMLEMDEIDAVHVCTFNQAHAAPSIAAMKAGKHVMCEKPMSASLPESIEMVKTSKETGKLLMIAITSRFRPDILAAKKIAESGDIGEIYYAETVADRRRGIPGGTFVKKETAGLGAVADIGIYALDEALNIMGFPKPVSVSGYITDIIAKTHKAPIGYGWRDGWNSETFDVDEFATAWIGFENGSVLVFKTSWAMHMDTLGGTFFLGDKGGIRIKPEFKVFRDEWGHLVDIEPTLPQLDHWGRLFEWEIQAFYDAIRAGEPSPNDPMTVLLSDVIIDGIVRSSAQGGEEVKVEVPNL